MCLYSSRSDNHSGAPPKPTLVLLLCVAGHWSSVMCETSFTFMLNLAYILVDKNEKKVAGVIRGDIRKL